MCDSQNFTPEFYFQKLYGYVNNTLQQVTKLYGNIPTTRRINIIHQQKHKTDVEVQIETKFNMVLFLFQTRVERKLSICCNSCFQVSRHRIIFLVFCSSPFQKNGRKRYFLNKNKFSLLLLRSIEILRFYFDSRRSDLELSLKYLSLK